MKRAILGLALLVLSATAAHAQTYTSTANFTTCHPSSNYPIVYFSQFTCSGVLYGDTGAQFETFMYNGGSFELYDVTNAKWLVISVYCDPQNVCHNSSLTVTNFSPGTFAYTWSGYDENGGFHTGTAAGTWYQAYHLTIHGRWYYPVIKAGSSITITE